MDKDEICIIDDWFKKKEKDSYETYHHTEKADGEDVYAVSAYDIEDFTDLLGENFPDLIGLQCMIGGGGIWFRSGDLAKADYY